MKRSKMLNARGWRLDGIMRPDVREACNYPLRQAVRYTAAEIRDLVAQRAVGARVEDIASWHQRSVGGVSFMLQKLGATP